MKNNNKEHDKLYALIYVDREELGADLMRVYSREMTREDLTPDDIEYLVDNLEYQEIPKDIDIDSLSEEEKKELAIKTFLEDGVAWGYEYDGLLLIKPIKKKDIID